eukprot:659584-Amphidinium_carterae.1
MPCSIKRLVAGQQYDRVMFASKHPRVGDATTQEERNLKQTLEMSVQIGTPRHDIRRGVGRPKAVEDGKNLELDFSEAALKRGISLNLLRYRDQSLLRTASGDCKENLTIM